MKNSILILSFISLLFVCSASSCKKEDELIYSENTTPMENGNIKIKIGSNIFTAKLLDNNSAKAFKEVLPLKLDMTELNGNEKYFDLPNSLPTNSVQPQTIKNGDLMLYGSKTLVLFYKKFSTTYSYTKLATVEDTTGLASALGSGNATVTFTVK